MGINIGNTEFSKIYLGDDKVISGYLHGVKLYEDSVTLTLNFTDNTPEGASLNNTNSIVLVGPPGSTFTTSKVINRASNYTINAATVSGNTDNLLTIGTQLSGNAGFENIDLTFSGTYPESNTTLDLGIDCTATLKTARGCSIGGNFGGTNSNGGGATFFPTWSGGSTGGYSPGGTLDEFGSFSASCSPTSGTSNTRVDCNWNSGVGSWTSITFRVSISENDTHQSCSSTGTRNF